MKSGEFVMLAFLVNQKTEKIASVSSAYNTPFFTKSLIKKNEIEGTKQFYHSYRLFLASSMVCIKK